MSTASSTPSTHYDPATVARLERELSVPLSAVITAAEERAYPPTWPAPVSMALDLASTAKREAIDHAWDDAAGQITQADAARQRTEDIRSVRRNRNRLYMLLAGFVMALLWPLICTALHMPAGKQWTSAISVTGDLTVTAYALLKRY
jgi:hypothetical protein